MRYDREIYFQRIADSTYIPETGNYEPPEPVETKCWANVMDTQTETLRLVYGELRQGSLTVQLQQPYTGMFDRIRVGDKVYSVDLRRRLRGKETFIVSEVQ